MIRRALYDGSAVAIGAPLGIILAVIITAAEKLRAWMIRISARS